MTTYEDLDLSGHGTLDHYLNLFPRYGRFETTWTLFIEVTSVGDQYVHRQIDFDVTCDADSNSIYGIESSYFFEKERNSGIVNIMSNETVRS